MSHEARDSQRPSAAHVAPPFTAPLLTPYHPDIDINHFGQSMCQRGESDLTFDRILSQFQGELQVLNICTLMRYLVSFPARPSTHHERWRGSITPLPRYLLRARSRDCRTGPCRVAVTTGKA